MSEDAFLTGKLEPKNEPYVIAKVAGIIMWQSYNREKSRGNHQFHKLIDLL